MKKIGFIFFIFFSFFSFYSHSEGICSSENKFLGGTLCFSALNALVYEATGIKFNVGSIKHRYKGIYEKEINSWIKDTYTCSLMAPLSNVFFEEFFKKFGKDSFDEKKFSSIFKANLRLFSKLFDVLPGFYEFFKTKFKKCSKKALTIALAYNSIFVALNSKVNKKIDDWGNKKENFKTLNKSVAKSAWFLSKNLVVNKIFENLIVLTLLFSSRNNIYEFQNDIAELETINKQTYNFADLGLISYNALKSF